MSNFPKISIIILNFNTYKDTLELIESINALIDYNNYNIIVVDNASNNESAEILKMKEQEYNFHLIANTSNSGYAAGNNIGIRYSYGLGSEYAWILNNDILLTDKDILTKLVAFMETHLQIGAISPKTFRPSGEEEIPLYWRPTLWDLTFGCISYRNRKHMYEAKYSMQVYRPKGCCMLLRNEYMKRIREMDERTFLYLEENILAERMLQYGYECWLYIDASIIHRHSGTVNTVYKKKKMIKILNDSYKIYLKDYMGINSLIIRWLAVLVNTMIAYRIY